MSVVNAGPSDLLSASALMRWLTNELIANHRFTARFADVSGTATWGSTDTLRWLDRPSAETFYGDSPLTIGIRNSDSTRSNDTVPISLGLQIGKALFSSIDPGSGTRWMDLTWKNNATVQRHVQPGMGDTPVAVGAPVGVSGMETGPFIAARLITNPTSNSATPSEPLYFYVVVETSVGVFRKFGFGEVHKFYDWEGGIFCMGDIFNPASTLYSTEHSLFGSGSFTGSVAFTGDRDEAPGYIWAPGWTGISDDTDDDNGRGWMALYCHPTAQRAWPALGWEARGGLNFMSQSPSAFSLQSERNPAIVFGGNQRLVGGTDFEIHPMGMFPDLFQATITDVNAYGVFQEADGKRYMVVPHYNKLIDEFAVGGSGRYGLLIRNPDLTVTIT